MSELHTIRNRYNAIVSAGNDINSSLSSFAWGKSYDSVNNVARQIDGLQRAIAALAEVRHLVCLIAGRRASTFTLFSSPRHLRVLLVFPSSSDAPSVNSPRDMCM